MDAIDHSPGFRRRVRVTAGAGWVCSELEDDYHCMAVTLRHAQGIVHAVEPVLQRAPWTTCPGAVDQLQATFGGQALQAFAARGDKTQNCTHLHDLALLAAAHAQRAEPLVYDIRVSDPVAGRRAAEILRDGQRLLGWIEQDGCIAEPAALEGLRLDQLKPWIDRLEPPLQEAARLLRWGAVIAHGRVIPMDRQSDARRMPPNCYSFQPKRAAVARRVGEVRDFSQGTAQPLDPSINTRRDGSTSRAAA